MYILGYHIVTKYFVSFLLLSMYVSEHVFLLFVLQYTDDVCFVVFAFFNVAWATLYLEHWKRRSAVHAYRWGTLDKQDELLVEPRALFYVSKCHYCLLF